MATIDFDKAIAAHSDWKRKLATYIRKPDKSLTVAEAEVDSKCALGQWIYGDGSRYSSMPEYSQLKSAHAHFHTAAAQIISRADSGPALTEDAVLGAKSEFGQSSTQVILAIKAMREKSN
ncbi:MAG: CZB domain-containing protein [Terriglobales bacterium]